MGNLRVNHRRAARLAGIVAAAILAVAGMLRLASPPEPQPLPDSFGLPEVAAPALPYPDSAADESSTVGDPTVVHRMERPRADRRRDREAGGRRDRPEKPAVAVATPTTAPARPSLPPPVPAAAAGDGGRSVPAGGGEFGFER